MRRKQSLRVSLVSIICALTMLLAACGGTETPSTSSNDKADESQQILYSSSVGAGQQDLGSFDPALATDLYSGRVISSVFTGLVSLNLEGEIQPQLAESWSVSDDGLVWTFKLKEGLKFSNGTALTAEDVAYSLNRAFLPDTKSPTAPYYLGYILNSDKVNAGEQETLIGDSLIVQDDLTIQIKLNQPVSFFLYSLTFIAAYVVDQEIVEKYGEQWVDHLSEGGGAGPFKVKSYQRGATEVVLEPNENYYGEKPQLKEIHYPFIQDIDGTLDEYEADRLHDSSLPRAQYPSYKDREDFYEYETLGITYFAFNMTKKPFDILEIRQAFALAIDKQLIAETIWEGSYEPTNHIIPKGMPGYNPDLKGPDGTDSVSGNPEKAKELLEKGLEIGGYDSIDDLPEITLTYSSSGAQATKDTTAQLQQDIKEVLGIEIKTNDVDFNTLIGQTNSGASNPLQFFSGPAWIADYPDPSNWTSLQFGEGSANNGTNFGQNNSADAPLQQQLQKDLEAADKMENGEARLNEYKRIEQELVNQVAWLPMMQQKAIGLRKACVQGYPENGPAMGIIPPDHWSKIYISTNSDCAKR